MPVGHEDGARVTANAGQAHLQRCRRGDFFDDANRALLLLQNRSLLDMQLDKPGVSAWFEWDGVQRSMIARARAPVLQGFAFGVT